jgi:carbonic anhydrase
MKYFNTARLNLGIPTLLADWRAMLSPKYLVADTVAGLTVAFIAIPLSLAIALASNVSPETGLITAIVAGIVCAFFGSAPLAVSGPTAAMAIIIADNIEKFGMTGVVLICFMAGLMQLLSGLTGLGRFARYIPLPVIAGFTAGIGAIILIGQLPRAFGLEPPPESHIFSVIQHLFDYMHQINYLSLSLVGITLLVIYGLTQWLPRIPPILPAVAVTTAIVYYFNLSNTSHIELIGTLPSTLPHPAFPDFQSVPLTKLAWNAFSVYLLASVETLLSCTALEKMAASQKIDPNQELVGQGLGNIAVSLFGGMPGSNLIARSIINVKAGAKTRRSSIIHALTILIAILAIGPLIALIPIAALAGVLFFVSVGMLNYKEFYLLWRMSRSEAMIYAITFLGIIFVDLVAGIQVGIAAASIWVLLKATKTQFHISSSTHDRIIRLSLSGSLTFLSSNEIAELEKRLHNANPGEMVIIDLSRMINLDSSGATAIIDLNKLCLGRDVPCYIKGLARRFEPLFHTESGKKLLDEYYIVSENELREKHEKIIPLSSRGRLVHGVQRSYTERQNEDKRLFEFLSKKQDPHTLFITCADSRIIPSNITSSDPGDLFIVRNVGNFIPPFSDHMPHGEAAALEFALSQLNITDIVVCGHANCGAIHASVAQKQTPYAELNQWIDQIRSELHLSEKKSVDEFAMDSVLNQIKHLKTYPIVKRKLAEGTLTLHAWFYHFDQSIVYEWDEKTNAFKSILDLE